MPKKQEIEISPLAFAKIIDWTAANTEREVGGYLIGKLINGKVIITDAIFATAESNPVFVSFDNMAQITIVERLAEEGRGEIILGWMHSHPSFGCFLSGTDIATQNVYQALFPQAVAMVTDGNAYAKSRNLSDFQAHFYRTKKDNQYHEVHFGVMTDPNDLLELLTRYLQDHESPEKIAERTAREMVLSMTATLNQLSDKFLSKDEFAEADLLIKKTLAATRTDLEKISKQLLPKKELLERFEKTDEAVTQLREKFISSSKRQEKELKFLRIFSFLSIIVSIVSLLTIILVILFS